MCILGCRDFNLWYRYLFVKCVQGIKRKLAVLRIDVYLNRILISGSRAQHGRVNRANEEPGL